jgi:hypothetical protein
MLIFRGWRSAEQSIPHLRVLWHFAQPHCLRWEINPSLQQQAVGPPIVFVRNCLFDIFSVTSTPGISGSLFGMVTRPELTNLSYGCPKRNAAITALRIFFNPFAQPVSLQCWEDVFVHIQTYLTAQRLVMHYRYYQIILRVKHFFTNRERCEVLTG